MLVSEKKLEKVICRVMGIEEKDDKKIDVYRKQIRELKDEVADLKKTKEIEETKIKHFVKMREEKQEVDAKKKELAIKEKYQDKEMGLMKEYYEKTIKMLAEFKSEIIERLPNVNWQIGEKKDK